MILPVAVSLLALAQVPASSPSRPDAGGATARISSLQVEPAPGHPRVLVSGVPAVPPDFEAWLGPENFDQNGLQKKSLRDLRER